MRNGKGVRRHLFAVLTVAAIVALSAGSAFAQSTWLETIHVAETGGTSIDLQFGVHPSGTDGVDAIDEDGVVGADEVAQPPLPPAGNFDARFSDSQLILDYRAGTSPQGSHTYPVAFQRAAGGNITLTWNSTTLATKVTSAQMQDTFGGVLGIDLDMTAQNSIEITNAAITGVNIILTSVDAYVPPVQYTQLTITAQPAASGNAPLSLGTITVVAETAGGTAANTNVAITVAENGVGTLGGTTTQTATNATSGVATFGDLVYDNVNNTPPDPETIALTFSAVDWQGNAISVTSNNISVTQPPLGIPVVTGPGAAVEGTNENQTPTFTWPAAINAVSYQINLGTAASSPGCDDILSNAAVTSTSYTSARLADGTGYCAKVRSVDANGVTSAYSNTVTFDVIPTFGEWGMIFLIASMVLCGGYFLQRRRAGSNA